jgi:dihydroneopterin aldolase/2-amino-4-hydroxy-6-hydroxymethyldihydropteridine diphosphokinase
VSAVEVEVVVALGTNLGDRLATLRGAVDALDAVPGLTVQVVSPMVETDPVGGPEQPDYLNAVLVATTSLTPSDLLAELHNVEAGYGRSREVRWGARTLDLDLIVFGRAGSDAEVVSDDPVLTLPHPRAHERAFVLAPWARLQPGASLRLPSGQVRPVLDLLAEAADRSGVRPVEQVLR